MLNSYAVSETHPCSYVLAVSPLKHSAPRTQLSVNNKTPWSFLLNNPEMLNQKPLWLQNEQYSSFQHATSLLKDSVFLPMATTALLCSFLLAASLV